MVIKFSRENNISLEILSKLMYHFSLLSSEYNSSKLKNRKYNE